MKNKILLITTGIFVVLSLFSCCKEETPNGSSQNTLTDEELKFLPYNIGDTIHFREIYSDGYCEDTVDYYVKAKTQTGSYVEVRCFVEGTARTAHLCLQKTSNGHSLWIDYYQLNQDSTEGYKVATIGKYHTAHYDTITLDGKLYHNVYMTESDTTHNSESCMYIKRAYYNSTYGIIRIDFECYGYNIY